MTSTAETTVSARRRQSVVWPFVAGALIGVLGGLIGLGGAEFRLPLLMALFGFAALQAVILNKAMSLIVVATALPARAFAVAWGDVADHWWIVANLLAGSLIGAWLAAGWATRMHARTLHRVLALLLVAIALVLAATHYTDVATLELSATTRSIAGVLAGVVIGMVAAFMGVAGGELLIPTIVLLFSVDIRLAGSLSLLVSLPTMLVAFARYSQDSTFAVLHQNLRFVLLMGLGSVAGAVAGGALLQYVASPALRRTGTHTPGLRDEGLAPRDARELNSPPGSAAQLRPARAVAWSCVPRTAPSRWKRPTPGNRSVREDADDVAQPRQSLGILSARRIDARPCDAARHHQGPDPD